jgi:Holliday junction resolvasome RuvABC endonuclease subunit
MKTIIGLDPGKNGSIAWITDGKPCVEKMPETLQDLWELIGSIRTSGDPCERLSSAVNGMKAYIESVHSSPQMGVTSAFTFGQGFGRLEMALTAAGIPFERVTPQKWQGAMGCRTGGDKNVSKAKAQELFPQMKVTHATADALLIAEYGNRIERGVK